MLAARTARRALSSKSLPPEWTKLAEAELKGKPATSLIRASAEGIAIKPVYTVADVESIAAPPLPGVFPFTRGVRATMYTAHPWTIRQVCSAG